MSGRTIPVKGTVWQRPNGANLATTQRYLEHIAPADVVEAMQQRLGPDVEMPGGLEARNRAYA